MWFERESELEKDKWKAFSRKWVKHHLKNVTAAFQNDFEMKANLDDYLFHQGLVF